jgi:hypothetical protein
MQFHCGSPAGSLDEQIRQLTKSAQQIAHEMVLMREETARLQEAVDAATKRKSRKRRYIQTEETLTVGEVSDLVAEMEGSRRNDGEQPAKRVCAERQCGHCSKMGQNSHTCMVEIEDIDNSDASD